MSYNEIFALKDLLTNSGIPFNFGRIFDGYQIVIETPKGNIDAVQHFGSIGGKNDLLEIMGGLTTSESTLGSTSVLGWLRADEVFKRFSYCYTNNTTVYK